MPWILAGGGVVVIAVVVVLILVLTGGSDTSSSRGAAEAIVKAINDRDLDAAKAVLCDKNSDAVSFDALPKDAKFELGDVKENGDKATATVTGTSQGRSRKANFYLAKKDGKWCVSDFGASSGSGT